MHRGKWDLNLARRISNRTKAALSSDVFSGFLTGAKLLFPNPRFGPESELGPEDPPFRLP